jgi:glycosyltransferase involved in cell wall biosynthesis
LCLPRRRTSSGATVVNYQSRLVTGAEVKPQARNADHVKILMGAYSFEPRIGGIETASKLLATEFVRLGHEVRVVTRTRESDNAIHPFEVVRRPALRRTVELFRWADVYFQVHISLLMAWPLLLVKKPWIVSQQTWLPAIGASGAWKGRLKRYLLRFATTVAISEAIARDVPSGSRVIGDPYDAATFRPMPGVKRDAELVFVGRLVLNKGVHIVLEALALLKSRGKYYRLTVVGQGPEEEALRWLANELHLVDQVSFVGIQTGVELATILNAHQMLIVPSLWDEPFGVVALEGCACGCVVVGSDRGGLPDAIGPCGVTFPNGDSRALADQIDQLLSEPSLLARYPAVSQSHLDSHTPRRAATAYLQVLESALIRTRHSN